MDTFDEYFRVQEPSSRVSYYLDNCNRGHIFTNWLTRAEMFNVHALWSS